MIFTVTVKINIFLQLLLNQTNSWFSVNKKLTKSEKKKNILLK